MWRIRFVSPAKENLNVPSVIDFHRSRYIVVKWDMRWGLFHMQIVVLFGFVISTKIGGPKRSELKLPEIKVADGFV